MVRWAQGRHSNGDLAGQGRGGGAITPAPPIGRGGLGDGSGLRPVDAWGPLPALACEDLIDPGQAAAGFLGHAPTAPTGLPDLPAFEVMLVE